jgi:hypothetical protein
MTFENLTLPALAAVNGGASLYGLWDGGVPVETTPFVPTPHPETGYAATYTPQELEWAGYRYGSDPLLPEFHQGWQRMSENNALDGVVYYY